MPKKIKLGFQPPAKPNDYASTFIGARFPSMRPKVVRDKSSHDKVWVRFYVGKVLVWHCNYDFYKTHFSKVTA